MEERSHTRFRFQDFSGYLLSRENARHEFLVVRHSAFVAPWTDQDVHLHESSEELFLLLNGELIFLISDQLFSLLPGEIIMIRPSVPHAIVGGSGLIEHFGLRAPAADDRQSLGALQTSGGETNDDRPREIKTEWGFRVPLYVPSNKNCWVIGYGQARFPSSQIVFAYLDFPTHSEANMGIETRHRLHMHRSSWEYYVVVKGSKMLQINDQEVTISPGEMLEVNPGTRHTLLGRQAPFIGFTFRVPVLDDKVEF